MNGGLDQFIDAAFRHGPGIEHSSRLRKRDYPELAVAGGTAAGLVTSFVDPGLGQFSVSWMLGGVAALTSFYVGNLCTGYLSARVAQLTTTIPGLEHQERPDFLKQLNLLQLNLYALSNGPSQNLMALTVLARLVTVIVLLATVDPILALMPLIAAFPVVGDDLAARRRERTSQAVTERTRLANSLFDLASTPAQASELRSFGLREVIARRHESLNAEVRREVARSAEISALQSAAGWLVFGAGFAGAIVLLAIRAVHGQTSYGDVVMVAVLIQRTQQQMSAVSSTISQIATNSRAAQYLFWLEDHHRTVRQVIASPRPVPEALARGDEPTASLDAPTEAALFERYVGASRRSAERSGAVTVFVSHRFSTVRTADLIVVLHEGRVVETGSHADLIASGGRYAELFELQARSYR